MIFLKQNFLFITYGDFFPQGSLLLWLNKKKLEINRRKADFIIKIFDILSDYRPAFFPKS